MERELIARIAAAVDGLGKDPSVVVGVGDDCAVVDVGPGHLLVTTDTMIEGVHFDLSYFDPWHLGRKAASVNLSDIAAMGGQPRWAMLNLAVPPGIPPAFWGPFSQGLLRRLREFGAVLLGGDTVASLDRLAVTLTLLGQTGPGGWLSRSAAQPGDIVYCSGGLGEAAAGLALLEVSHKRLRATGRRAAGRRQLAIRQIVRAHLDPIPQVALGQALTADGMVRAAIDLSDGLATDLAHICLQSGVKAMIDEDALPVSRAVRWIARALGRSPLPWAISGGEDFHLLWTVAPAREAAARRIAARILGHLPFRVGRIVSGSGVWLNGRRGVREITFQGYEHIV